MPKSQQIATRLNVMGMVISTANAMPEVPTSEILKETIKVCIEPLRQTHGDKMVAEMLYRLADAVAVGETVKGAA